MTTNPMTADPALLTATELLARYRTRSLSPVEVVRACLDRIARLDGALNAFCLVDAPGALVAARASEDRWVRGEPLGRVDGVPASVKDLLLTRGWPTRRGSRAVDPDRQTWDEDAPAVARLRAHGAVLIGKTTTPEFGFKGVTDSPLTGITRNPWNPGLTPGGSSGGAAVAAAAGMAALNIGTDGGGSIRIPASFTGVVGYKPSFGRVPVVPSSPFGTLAHIGPITRSVADAALMLQVMAGPDPRDWFALPYVDGDFRTDLDGGVADLRIAYAPTLGGADVAPEVAALVQRAARTFADLGARVRAVDLELPTAPMVFRRHWTVGAAALLAEFSAAQRQLMEPSLCAFAAEGAAVPVLDYVAAERERARIGARMNLFHREHDLLLTPTLPLTAFPAGVNHPMDAGAYAWVDWTPFTYPFNLTQQPAISLPCGMTAAGLPVGLQIVGPMHHDARVLRAARAFETVFPVILPPS